MKTLFVLPFIFFSFTSMSTGTLNSGADIAGYTLSGELVILYEIVWYGEYDSDGARIEYLEEVDSVVGDGDGYFEFIELATGYYQVYTSDYCVKEFKIYDSDLGHQKSLGDICSD